MKDSMPRLKEGKRVIIEYGLEQSCCFCKRTKYGYECRAKRCLLVDDRIYVETKEK